MEYIKQHEGPNENQIVNALHQQKVSSKRTTLKKIRELKEKGEIIDSLKEGESGFHRLYINKDNEFNKIDNMLRELENINSIIMDPLRKFPPPKLSESKIDFDLSAEYRRVFEDLLGTYEKAIPILIQELLNITKNKIYSDADKQILYSRILKVQQGFVAIKGTEPSTTQKLGHFVARLGHVDSKAPYLARVKKTRPDFLNESEIVARKFQRVLESFKKDFLSEK